MLRFVARRLLQMVPLLIGITFLSFAVVDLAPGDFFSTLRMNPSISPALIREMELEFGDVAGRENVRVLADEGGDVGDHAATAAFDDASFSTLK